MNQELPDVQAGFRKSRGPRDQITNIHRESKRISEKYLLLLKPLVYAKAFDCVDHSKLWKILKETGVPYHLTCLLIILYAAQEATF